MKSVVYIQVLGRTFSVVGQTKPLVRQYILPLKIEHPGFVLVVGDLDGPSVQYGPFSQWYSINFNGSKYTDGPTVWSDGTNTILGILFYFSQSFHKTIDVAPNPPYLLISTFSNVFFRDLKWTSHLYIQIQPGQAYHGKTTSQLEDVQ